MTKNHIKKRYLIKLWYNSDVNKHKKKESPKQSAIDNIALMTADIPVKISIVYNGENIFEYDQVIDIIFTTDTAEGKQNATKMTYLKQEKGLSTEDALFTMANDEFIENPKYIASKLKFPNLKGIEGSQELRFLINRNGEIEYRKLI
jgi:hypothetical protein